jgi:hypothetical protein
MKRVLFLLAALAIAAPARAAPKSIREELPQAARMSWDSGRALFEVQNWPAAATEYHHVYELSHNPRVLFNFAACEKNQNHYLKALLALRQELTEGGSKLPDTEVREVRAALATVEPLVSAVSVTANEEGASLTVDNEAQPGVTPFSQPIPIDVGPHTLKLTKPGFAETTFTVMVAGGTVAQAKLELQPVERKGHARIEVTGPTRATILIDGRDLGNAPFDGELVEGSHQVQAQAEDYVTGRSPLVVKYKDSVSLVVGLAHRRHEGLLRVSAQDGSIIIVDGMRVGMTHWEGPLTSHEGHQVIVKKDGFYPLTQEIQLADDQDRPLPVTLNPEKTWIWWTLAGVLIVGGAVAVSVAVAIAATHDPVPGTLAAGTGWGTTSFHGFHF